MISQSELQARAEHLLDLNPNPGGSGDFGPHAPGSSFLPLSDHWRQPINRRIDWSTRILLLASHLVGSDSALLS